MEGLEVSSECLKPGYHALKISHAMHTKKDSWQVDGRMCIVLPPNLDFDNMPAEVTSIHAHYVSQGPPDQPYLSPDDPEAYFYPDSQVIHDFAYKGNVDMEAWADMQHEMAASWFLPV